MSDENLLREAVAELERRTCAVIVTPGGQALACSEAVKDAYDKLSGNLADEKSHRERMVGALNFYANGNNWGAVAEYSDRSWYMSGRPWLKAYAALKDSGEDVDLLGAPTDPDEDERQEDDIMERLLAEEKAKRRELGIYAGALRASLEELLPILVRQFASLPPAPASTAWHTARERLERAKCALAACGHEIGIVPDGALVDMPDGERMYALGPCADEEEDDPRPQAWRALLRCRCRRDPRPARGPRQPDRDFQRPAPRRFAPRDKFAGIRRRAPAMRFRLRRAFHRLLCRFGWHIGGNLPWTDEGRHYCRCLWCEREFQLIGGEWRDYIRPPRPTFHSR